MSRGTWDWRSTSMVFLAALLLPMTSATAQTTGIHANRNPAAAAAVEKLELKLCDLLVRGEWDAYAAHLTDDYVRLLPGKIQNKAEVLAEMRSSAGSTLSMVPEKMQTRIYGDTAITIINLYTRKRSVDGTIQDSRGRATKIFVQRNGRWYLAQLTGSPSR